jgi:hypothetical protein
MLARAAARAWVAMDSTNHRPRAELDRQAFRAAGTFRAPAPQHGPLDANGHAIVRIGCAPRKASTVGGGIRGVAGCRLVAWPGCRREAL